MKYAIPLSSDTTGQILSKESFGDLYLEVMDEGRRYFWRMNSERKVELVIVFENIEDFDRSLETGVTIDFQAYKNRFLLVVWTVSDPANPLGFPISFEKNEGDHQTAVDQILSQTELTIHYLTLLEDDLLHIYSQAVDLSVEEIEAARRLFEQEPLDEEEEAMDSEFTIKETNLLHDIDLCSAGVGYLLDYSSLLQKFGEEQAREKLLSAILTAVDLVKRHPREDVRNCSIIVWAAERREMTTGGEVSVLMEIYITPPLLQLEVINNDQQIENPFSTVLLSMPEFLTTLEAKPINRGAYPLLQYEDKMISFIEPDKLLQERLASLSETMPNPYLIEGDEVADGEA